MAEKDLDAETMSSMRRFYSLLGEDWSGWQTGAPLANRFRTTFQAGPPEGVRLRRLIDSLDGVLHRDLAVRQGLGSKSWQHFSAAVMALEFASRVKTGGSAVEFVKNGSTECPDVRAHLAGRPVVVELKALHDQDEMEDWNALVDLLFDLRHPFLFDELDIEFEWPALDHPDAVYDGLVALSASADAQWRALPRGVGRARQRQGELGSFRVPLVEKSTADRLVLKLKSWCKQLRGYQEPTLLVVQAPNTFDFHSPIRLLEQIQELELQLHTAFATKRMISGVLVYEKPFLPPLPTRARIVGRSCVVTGSADGFGIIGTLVPNPVARVSLTQDELKTAICTIAGKSKPTVVSPESGE